MNKNNSHMKTIIRTLACLGVFVLMASCQMYEIDTQMTPEKQAASIRMVCDALPSYTVASTNADAVIFNVSANTPWTITRSSGADWCTITPSSSSAGALISDVVVSFADNATAEDRTATLTLKADKVGLPVTIQITQNRLGKLFVTPVAGDYAAVGGPLTFSIQTNVAWEVHSDKSWLTFDREAGEPDPEGRTFTIRAIAAASNVLERTATVTVKAGDDEENFDVTQKGVFDLTEISDSFDANGDTKFILLRTDLPWTITADKDWIGFDEYSGTGDGSLIEIEATGYPNEGAARKANVTVSAGGVNKTFEVSQDGQKFEIVEPESTTIKGGGEEIILEVNSKLTWEPETSVKGWSVEKVDATHFKVIAGWNELFVEKKGTVSITGAGGAEDSLELTQEMNFTFKGHTELLEDGSVKVYEDQVSGILTKDSFQYVIMDVDVEMHLGDKGSFLMGTQHYSDGGYEYQLYLDLNRTDPFRLRSNGAKVTTRGGKQFTFDKTKLDAMTHAQIQFVPNEEDPTKIDQSFYWNGEKQDLVLVSTSVYAADPTLKGNYEVSSIVKADDGSYFIVKSCTVTPVE